MILYKNKILLNSEIRINIISNIINSKNMHNVLLFQLIKNKNIKSNNDFKLK